MRMKRQRLIGNGAGAKGCGGGMVGALWTKCEAAEEGSDWYGSGLLEQRVGFQKMCI